MSYYQIIQEFDEYKLFVNAHLNNNYITGRESDFKFLNNIFVQF